MTTANIKILKWLAFIIATALAITTIFVLPRLQRKIPNIPDNMMHTKILKIEECIQCHINPLKKTLPESHAARQQCLYCHKYTK